MKLHPGFIKQMGNALGAELVVCLLSVLPNYL
jgi:hypothetical protein